MDDNSSLRTPVLSSHPHFGFKPLETIWAVIFLIVLMLLVEFIALAYVFVWTTSPIRCDLFYLMVYAYVSLWTINFIIRFYINWKHRICLMAKGYFNFYDTCSNYIEMPFYVTCIWLGILAVMLCLYIEYDNTHTQPIDYCNTSYFYSPIVAITVAISLQNALVIPLFSIYIIKVYEFNKRQDPPESENGGQWMPNTLRETLASGDVGYRERYEVIDNMIEKQADLIRYYKEANDVLNKKIFDLTSQYRSTLDAN